MFAGIWRIDVGDVDRLRRTRLLPRDVNGLWQQTQWAGDVGTSSLFRRGAGGGVQEPGAVRVSAPRGLASGLSRLELTEGSERWELRSTPDMANCKDDRGEDESDMRWTEHDVVPSAKSPASLGRMHFGSLRGGKPRREFWRNFGVVKAK